MTKQSKYYLIISLIVFASSCSKEASYEREEPAFVLMESDLSMDRSSTGGVSLIDIDNDYDLDIYVSNGYDVSAEDAVPQKNRLYINDGAGNLKLDGESVLSNDSMFSSGSTWGDYNNDGFIDVFIANQRAQNNALYKGTEQEFVKVENIISNDLGHSYSANWSDIDNDGDLDLYVANGGLSNREEDFLYRNDGQDSFQKISSTSITKDTLSTIGGLWRDFNGDGLPDLYASYRLQLDRVFLNKGDWEFEVVELEASVSERYAFPKSAGTVADIDSDGDLDIYQTSLMGGANFLFLNDGKGNFSFKKSGALTSVGGHTYGAAFSDFNNDGFLEVVVANWGSQAQLFEKKGGEFKQISEAPFSSRIFFASTIVSGDITGDGKPDLLIPQWPNSKGDFEENVLYKNTAVNPGNWIKIKLVGTVSNKSGIGSKISLHCNDKILTRFVSSQQTWRAQGGLIQLFGIGDCRSIDKIIVDWPSTHSDTIRNIPINQITGLIEASKN